MAAVGAHPVLYHHPAPAGDASSMSSYFSHGGSSTTSSSASSFTAALAPTTTALAEHFDISEFLFDDAAGAGVAGAPGVFADGAARPVVLPDAAGGGAIIGAAAG